MNTYSVSIGKIYKDGGDDLSVMPRYISLADANKVLTEFIDGAYVITNDTLPDPGCCKRLPIDVLMFDDADSLSVAWLIIHCYQMDEPITPNLDEPNGKTDNLYFGKLLGVFDM